MPAVTCARPAEVVDVSRTRDLRRAVLRPGLPPNDPLPGDDNPAVVHFGVPDADGRLLSTGALFAEPCPWRAGPGWRLRQMATDPAHRGHGHGTAVLDAAIDYITAAGGGVLWCHARETAIGFYARAGFAGEGAVFTDGDTDLPHQHMWRDVAP